MIPVSFKRKVMAAKSFEEMEVIYSEVVQHKSWKYTDHAAWKELCNDALRILESESIVPLDKITFGLLNKNRSQDQTRPTLTMVEVLNNIATVTDGFVLLRVPLIAPDGVYNIDILGQRLWKDTTEVRYPDYAPLLKEADRNANSSPSQPQGFVTFKDIKDKTEYALVLTNGCVLNYQILLDIGYEKCFMFESTVNPKTRPVKFVGTNKGIGYWGLVMPINMANK